MRGDIRFLLEQKSRLLEFLCLWWKLVFYLHINVRSWWTCVINVQPPPPHRATITLWLCDARLPFPKWKHHALTRNDHCGLISELSLFSSIPLWEISVGTRTWLLCNKTHFCFSFSTILLMICFQTPLLFRLSRLTFLATFLTSSEFISRNSLDVRRNFPNKVPFSVDIEHVAMCLFRNSMIFYKQKKVFFSKSLSLMLTGRKSEVFFVIQIVK